MSSTSSQSVSDAAARRSSVTSDYRPEPRSRSGDLTDACRVSCRRLNPGLHKVKRASQYFVYVQPDRLPWLLRHMGWLYHENVISWGPTLSSCRLVCRNLESQSKRL